MLGSRQSPRLLPSVRPWLPLARLLQSSSACCHVLKPKGFAFLSQTSLVRLSVTVPSPLSVKRGGGHGAPARTSPSCPVPAQATGEPSVPQHSFCPVFGMRPPARASDQP